MDDYVQKPIDPVELRAKLAQWLMATSPARPDRPLHDAASREAG
jgi:DNA-binding response OmpR family regulator